MPKYPSGLEDTPRFFSGRTGSPGSNSVSTIGITCNDSGSSIRSTGRNTGSPGMDSASLNVLSIIL